jgi:uncharacterized protein (TIRG00374 family)
MSLLSTANPVRTVLNFLNSPAGKIFRYLVSAGIVLGFILFVDWHKLSALHGQIQLWPAVGAALLAGLGYVLHGPRWWLLLKAQGLPLSQGWAQRVTWIGTFYNSFLLGGLGGDAARLVYVCKDAPPRQRTSGIAATVLDRMLGMVVLFCLAILALATEAHALGEQSQLRWIFLVVLSSVTVAITLLCIGLFWNQPLLTKLERHAPRWFAEIAHKATDAFHALRSSPRYSILAVGVSFSIWALDFASVWLLAQSLGYELPFFKTCIAVSIAYAVTALPISVGGHGVREGGLLLALQGLGLLAASDDRALLLALGTWGITLLWSGVGGLVLLFSPAAASPLRTSTPVTP